MRQLGGGLYGEIKSAEINVWQAAFSIACLLNPLDGFDHFKRTAMFLDGVYRE